jgi:hypothetical protein
VIGFHGLPGVIRQPVNLRSLSVSHGSISRLVGVVVAAVLPLVSVSAFAQEAPRTISQYDKEASVQYVAAWEKGDRYGNGVLLQGGYKICGEYWGWHCQGIAELSFTHFDYFDANFKQFAVGVRFGKLMWPRIRTFVQLQGGVQNDGFENSSNGAVVLPGFGLNYAVTRRFDAHLLVDFPTAFYDGDTFNQARVAIGLGLPLGSR